MSWWQHPPRVPTRGLGLVPVVAGEMPDCGVALPDVRGGNIPAATQCLHARLSVSLDGTMGSVGDGP